MRTDTRKPSDRPWSGSPANLEKVLHGANSGYAGKRNLSKNTFLTVGEMPQRRLQIYEAPQFTWQSSSYGLSCDYLHPNTTHLFGNPMWAHIPAIPTLLAPSPKLEWNQTLFASLVFGANFGSPGTYSGTILVELLNQAGATIKSVSIVATVSYSGATRTFTLISGPTYDNNGPIDNFWGVRTSFGGASPDWFAMRADVAWLYQRPRVGGDFESFLLDFPFTGTAHIHLSNNYYSSPVYRAGPIGQALPWQLDDDTKRAGVAMYFLIDEFQSTNEDNYLGRTPELWTVDKNGADLEQMSDELNPSEQMLGLRSCAFGVPIGTEVNIGGLQKKQAFGVRLKLAKIEGTPAPTQSINLNLYGPLRTFWTITRR